MKILFIGPKVQEIGGFDGSPLQDSIKKAIHNKLSELNKEYKDLHVLSSLNLGIETWAAEIADELKINTHIYIPFNNFHTKWPYAAKQKYTYLLKKARQRIVVTDADYSAKAFNEAKVKIIEEADIIFHFFPLGDSTLKIAERLKKECLFLDADDEDEFYVRF